MLKEGREAPYHQMVAKFVLVRLNASTVLSFSPGFGINKYSASSDLFSTDFESLFCPELGENGATGTVTLSGTVCMSPLEFNNALHAQMPELTKILSCVELLTVVENAIQQVSEDAKSKEAQGGRGREAERGREEARLRPHGRR